VFGRHDLKMYNKKFTSGTKKDEEVLKLVDHPFGFPAHCPRGSWEEDEGSQGQQ